MAWMELHDTLPDHPKVICAAAALGMDKDTFVGKLVRLWVWALNHRESGRLLEGELETVAEVMRCQERPAALVAALVEVGLLDRVRGGYVIHDWEQYVSMLMAKREERRSQTRQRVQRYREKALREPAGPAPERPEESGGMAEERPPESRTAPAGGRQKKSAPLCGNGKSGEGRAKARAAEGDGGNARRGSAVGARRGEDGRNRPQSIVQVCSPYSLSSSYPSSVCSGCAGRITGSWRQAVRCPSPVKRGCRKMLCSCFPDIQCTHV